jgi:primosomal protein N' (replication factor Y)
MPGDLASAAGPAPEPALSAGTGFAQVAVVAPLRQLFTYRIPPDLAGRVEPGRAVRVPFGRRAATGFVVELLSASPVEAVRDIAGVEDEDLSLPPEVLRLGRWVADYYLAPLGEVLRAALPAGLGKTSPGEVPHGAGRPAEIRPSADQQAVLDEIGAAVGARRHAAFLLFGVTGSGKTEVYLRAAAAAVARGGKALILVPEIALTPQMVSRVEARFGARVALWHSALTPSRRREVWTRTRRGEIDVLVGARSAVFAPVPDLSLVVVDEEHESAYKQGESPRYHARDVAVVRARENDAVVVLGSATPSLESFRNAELGKYRLLRLPRRVEGRAPARVELVPLPGPGPAAERPVSTILSDPLREALGEALSRGEQAILFLNRRGHSTVVQCETCRSPMGCSQCDIALTWHAVGDRLLCHYCGRSRPRPARCSGCGGSVSVFKGVGTQRVERELARLYPGLRAIRLDTDSTRRRGSMEAALESFRRGEADLLLGTQMVAKGLDFPDVTLVGVVNADLQLFLPDFRSAERTFQLLTQVAGRSGRGTRPGRVLFQTAHPEHYALAAAARQDYEAFYEEETRVRRDPPYPPHRRLVNLLLDGRDEARVRGRAEEIARILETAIPAGGVDLLGPAPQPFSRLKGKHRWHLTLRGNDHRRLRALALAVLEMPVQRGVRLSVDVDPVSLL